MSYDVWMSRVNGLLIQMTGMGVDDLPDFNYRDAWADRWGVARTAKAVIKNAKEI